MDDEHDYIYQNPSLMRTKAVQAYYIILLCYLYIILLCHLLNSNASVLIYITIYIRRFNFYVHIVCILHKKSLSTRRAHVDLGPNSTYSLICSKPISENAR